MLLQLLRSLLLTWNIRSGQIVAGGENVADLEKIRADAPMLQQKMKPRHLTMIAVGALSEISFFDIVPHIPQVEVSVLVCLLGQDLLSTVVGLPALSYVGFLWESC